MAPDEIKDWVDIIGPTGVLVLLIVMVVIPVLRRFNSEKGELPAQTQVNLALMQKAIDDHEARIKALEAKPPRGRA